MCTGSGHDHSTNISSLHCKLRNLSPDESGKLGGIFSTVPTAPEGKTGAELWHLIVDVADLELENAMT